MSEYVEWLMFKGEVEETLVLNTALKFCKDQVDHHIATRVNNMFAYLPGTENLFNIYKEKGKVRLWDISRHELIMLEQIFTYRFVYWKHLKLLAVLGNQSDKTNFDVGPIVFQNGSDQDYEYSEWDTIITDDPSRKALKELRDKVSNGDLDDVVRKKYDYDEEDFSLDYCRKSYLYAYIEKELQIRAWLYNKTDDDIISFNMSDIRVRDMSAKTLCELVKCFNEYFAKLK